MTDYAHPLPCPVRDGGPARGCICADEPRVWEGGPTFAEAFVEQQRSDAVNHPPHYTSHPSGVECIQVTEHMGFNLGNAVKYVWRADLKSGTDEGAIEDLRKAAWYLDREIQRRGGAS